MTRGVWTGATHDGVSAAGAMFAMRRLPIVRFITDEPPPIDGDGGGGFSETLCRLACGVAGAACTAGCTALATPAGIAACLFVCNALWDECKTGCG